MNSIVDKGIQCAAPFEINSKLDPEELGIAFRKSGRLRIDDFLAPAGAVALYKHLRYQTEWRSFLISKEQFLGAPTELHGVYSSELEGEMLDCAYDGARKGFAYLYDANRPFPEDLPEGAISESAIETTFLLRLGEFLNSPSSIHFMRVVTAVSEIERVAIQATRFRSGHFEMFHCGTRSADNTGKRIAAFSLNLTPEWKPEWGGLLEFRAQNGDSVEAYVPCFNSLDLFGFPHGYWISQIASFAGGERFAISGRLYVDR